MGSATADASRACQHPITPVTYHLADYAHPDFGTSSLRATTWTASGEPTSATILTYSQSANAVSPFSHGQAPLFSRRRCVESAP
jgi:hypothetical protein